MNFATWNARHAFLLRRITSYPPRKPQIATETWWLCLVKEEALCIARICLCQVPPITLQPLIALHCKIYHPCHVLRNLWRRYAICASHDLCLDPQVVVTHPVGRKKSSVTIPVCAESDDSWFDITVIDIAHGCFSPTAQFQCRHRPSNAK